jgi:hypothetical protein
MSYSFDTMSRAWAQLSQDLPPAVREGEAAMMFGFLIEAMHEANHQLDDRVNKDPRVSRTAQRLETALLKKEG